MLAVVAQMLPFSKRSIWLFDLYLLYRELLFYGEPLDGEPSSDEASTESRRSEADW
jgi:hypothetical protein